MRLAQELAATDAAGALNAACPGARRSRDMAKSWRGRGKRVGLRRPRAGGFNAGRVKSSRRRFKRGLPRDREPFSLSPSICRPFVLSLSKEGRRPQDRHGEGLLMGVVRRAHHERLADKYYAITA